MKALVVGGAGFIGSHLCEALLAEGDKVVCADNFSLGTKENIAHLAGNPGFQIYETDAAVQEELDEVFVRELPDYVFHLAANSDIQASAENPEIEYRNTYTTTFQILLCMRRHGVKKLFFASTSAVYGDRRDEELTEETTGLSPISYYGAAKLGSEALISAFSHMNDLEVLVFRFPNVIGSRLTHGVIFDFLRKLKKDSQHLEILGDGRQTKPYLYVSDLIEAILKCKDTNKTGVTLYNAGAAGDTSVTRIADIICEELGLCDVEYCYTGGEGGWKGDVPRFRYCMDKIQKAGWSAVFTSDEAVRKTVRENILKKYTVVIQAGGKGTRMRELTKDMIPKPMLMMNGKPMLQWQIETCAKNGIRDFVIIIGYLGEKIREYFGDGAELGVSISYIEEPKPLGSAGALYFLKDRVTCDDFLLVFGDVMFELDIDRMIRFHEAHGGKATLLVHPNSHPYDSDLLEMTDEGLVTGIDSKGHMRDYWYENCVNAGIYVLSKSVIDKIAKPAKLELEQDILVPLIEKRKAYGYRTSEYVKDAGTPERFRKVALEQRKGIWERKCLKQSQQCIFFDRDGTLNQYRGLISTGEELELEEKAGEAVRRVNESGYLAIVVTNQPVVARGLCSVEDIKQIHRKLETLLGEQGAYLDDIIFCPHHPHKGYPEENLEYKIPCRCRKPEIGMLEQMADRYHINLSKSYIVGDSTVDIQTGIHARMRTVLVKTGQMGQDCKYQGKPDYLAENLVDAVEWILNQGKGEEDDRLQRSD